MVSRQRLIIDPYKQLESLEKSEIENHVFGAEIIKDGGAAATGYAAMQFIEMSEAERSSITSALLKYCELDTLAMVIIVEHWQEVLGALSKAA